MKHGLYLESLTLQNFATFENQNIVFNEKFNGIVGETGSGKSLVLDAFQLLLGARSDKKLVRKECDCAVVEGVFKVTNPKISQFFNETGFPLGPDREVIIKRVIYSTGKSKAFINQLNCQVSDLILFSKSFVDLVGQFENQKLGSSDYQLYLLDQYAKNENLLNNYKDGFQQYVELKSELEKLTIQSSEKEQREDYLRFQLNELDKISSDQNREAELVEIKNKLLNKEENAKALAMVQDMMDGDENNLLSSLKSVQKVISSSTGVFKEALIDSFNAALSSLEDFSYELSRIDLTEDEELSLDDVLEELDVYQRLKRKFNVDTADLHDLRDQFNKELASLQEIEVRKVALTKECDQIENELFSMASKLHTGREKHSQELGHKISGELSSLNMKGATFKVQVSKTEVLGPTGITKASFLAETNPGEGFYKIKDIASGGELSRILLCLRQIVAAEDSISIFFFDEIDTGIGGETAIKVAKALKKVSEKSQVLAITHLPQIARLVDEIIYVDKKSIESSDKVRTVSFVENKTGKEREAVINQLAGL